MAISQNGQGVGSFNSFVEAHPELMEEDYGVQVKSYSEALAQMPRRHVEDEAFVEWQRRLFDQQVELEPTDSSAA